MALVIVPMANDFDACGLYTTLNTSIFQPLAVVGALIAAAYFGLGKVVGYAFPEVESKIRKIPQGVIMGFLAFALGPWLIGLMVTAFGIQGSTC